MTKKVPAVLLILALLSVALILIARRANPLLKVNTWFILLGGDPAKFSEGAGVTARYDMMILDPDSHPALKTLKGRKHILLAYLSVGEAETRRQYWKRVEGRPWVIGRNPHWEGNVYVDVRSPEWKNILINECIPAITAQGFRGIMLDALDTAEYIETLDSGKYKGAKEAVISIVREIKKKYPGLLILSNNGYLILDDIAPYLSGMVVEGINMMPDLEAGGYIELMPGENSGRIARLKSIMKRYRLPVFNMDYAPANDARAREYCVKTSKELGFKPYVAERELDKIY